MLLGGHTPLYCLLHKRGADMSKEFLGGRQKALEDSFFAKESEKLRRELAEKKAMQTKRDALFEASGIIDDAVLEHLIALDIGSDTLVALSLVPLVEVAWADGNVDDKERQAILAAAEAAGLEKEGASGELLNRWLAEKPDRELLATWKEYVSALSKSLSGERRDALKQGLLRRARAVAEASGGVLGLGSKVSKSEQAVLDEFEQVFS